jgi:CheY-like chemotaxis protein
MKSQPLLHSPDGADPSAEPNGSDPRFAQDHPLRILIADDNYINRRVLSLLLQRLGYQVDTADNGRDCVASALSTTYDLLLVDVDMPEVSGIDCAEQLRRAGRKFPIVAVTATDPTVNRKACLEAGMTDFVSKPVSLPELKRVLRDANAFRVMNAPTPDPGNDGRESGNRGAAAGHLFLRLTL